jgi:hypothetical protein
MVEKDLRRDEGTKVSPMHIYDHVEEGGMELGPHNSTSVKAKARSMWNKTRYIELEMPSHFALLTLEERGMHRKNKRSLEHHAH